MLEIFIAFTAFILAFYQFAKPITYFRLNLGFINQSWVVNIIIITGLIAIIASFSHFFTNLDKATINVVVRSFFYQLPVNLIKQIIQTVFSITFIGLAIYLLSKSLKPSKFTKRNAEKYCSSAYSIIASGIEDNINALAKEISSNNDNIKEIFTIAAADSGNPIAYAYQLIELFSDELFCKTMVTHHPYLVYQIFNAIISNLDLYTGLGRKLINRLLLLMFTQKNSILYREEPYHGLGRFSAVKNIIFNNRNFLISDYRPLSLWVMGETSQANNLFIEKYFEVIKLSLKCYLEEKNDSNPEVIWAALHNIAEIIKHNNYLLPKDSVQAIAPCDALDTLRACSTQVSFFVNFLMENEKLFPPANSVENISNYSFLNNDKTIYGALADGLYQILEGFSINQHDHGTIRLLMFKIYRPIRKESKIAIAICERLDFLLKEKITDNLTRLLYPAITASLIYAYGLCEPEKAQPGIHQYLMTVLKKEFANAYASNSDLALDMLPKDTEYNPETLTLIQKNSFRYRRYKEIKSLKLDKDTEKLIKL